MPMNTAVKQRKNVRLNQDHDDLERRDRRPPIGSDSTMPTPTPAIARPNSSREDEDERQHRENRDVAARHVGRKSHRQRERPHEHAEDFDRDQQEVDRPRQAFRHHVLPVLHEAVRARAGDDDREEA